MLGDRANSGTLWSSAAPTSRKGRRKEGEERREGKGVAKQVEIKTRENG